MVFAACGRVKLNLHSLLEWRFADAAEYRYRGPTDRRSNWRLRIRRVPIGPLFDGHRVERQRRYGSGVTLPAEISMYIGRTPVSGKERDPRKLKVFALSECL